MIRDLAKNVLRKCGYVVSRYDDRDDPAVLRRKFCDRHGVNVVLDVGANAGQFAAQLRKGGYRGRIVSFEPLSEAFGKLTARARGDSGWSVKNYALGDRNEMAEINVAGNSWSSSLLDMLPRHVTAAPHSQYVGREHVQVRTLDSLFDQCCSDGESVFMKIDTQGFAARILDGARRSLDRIAGIQVELSLVPLYDGEPLIHEVTAKLYERGFSLVCLKQEFSDRVSGQQLQVDGLFFRV